MTDYFSSSKKSKGELPLPSTSSIVDKLQGIECKPVSQSSSSSTNLSTTTSSKVQNKDTSAKTTKEGDVGEGSKVSVC